MKPDSSYWDKFYSDADGRLLIPSQFASFVASEYWGCVGSIVELGCGNGRDALFFSSLGFHVVGVDASQQAIESVVSRSPGSAVFLHCDISESSLPVLLEGSIRRSGKLLIYSRFFLHAISQEQEIDLWALVKTVCQVGDTVAFEFRTPRDENLAKATHKHYRRFVNPLEIVRRAGGMGFICEYLVEGFGYAKYKNDDAHVARVLLKMID